ncbi:MAG: DoxX family membrane protein [Marinoscillum sp.]
MKKVSQIILGIFFITAGINHFINPEFYASLIPPYLPYHHLINLASGIVEFSLGLGVLIPFSQKMAASGIIILMVLFIPSHIYFVQMDSCIGNLCTEPWIGWVRLVVIHPLLILWAYWHSR